jgi:hypothetical protein
MSKETLSQQGTPPAQEWSAAEWWAEKTSRLARRNMTPSQRRLLAGDLRLLRKANSGKETLGRILFAQRQKQQVP